MNVRVPVLLCGLVMLAGCQDTIFESAPSDTVSACDEHFVGKWRLLSSDAKNDDELFVIVEPHCRKWRFIEDGKDDADTEKTVHVSFARAGDLPLVLLKIDDKNPNDAQARWRSGFQYLRYDFADKNIQLRPTDNKHIAHLLIDGGVSGRTERISREPTDANGRSPGSSELHNFVAGNPAEMARVAQLDGIFASDESYTLKPATDADIFKGAKKSKNAKP